MSPVIKRKADTSKIKDGDITVKRMKHTNSTHIKPEPAKAPSPQPSPEQSPAPGSTSAIEIEADGHTPKSFQDLGIIESLCDACTALGYKVYSSL